jgi:hypothetical protein
MSEAVVHSTVTQDQGELGERMLASLRGYWIEAQGYQKFLYGVGALLVLSAVFHTGVMLATGGSLEGDVSWRKPITFGESFGLTAISIAWIMTFLPKMRLLGWALALALGFANFGEVAWVSLQQWRGVPSHFNNSTPFDAGLFALAGVLILFTGIVILVVTLLSFFSLKAPPSLAWAIRLGLLLLVASQFFGLLMIRQEGHTFGSAGAMKVPHALALHGAQVLPLLAWLLRFSNWSESRRCRTVLIGSAGYIVWVAGSALQTFRGLAPLDLDIRAAITFAMGGLLFFGAYAATLTGLQKTVTEAGAVRSAL